MKPLVLAVILSTLPCWTMAQEKSEKDKNPSNKETTLVVISKVSQPATGKNTYVDVKPYPTDPYLHDKARSTIMIGPGVTEGRAAGLRARWVLYRQRTDEHDWDRFEVDGDILPTDDIDRWQSLRNLQIKYEGTVKHREEPEEKRTHKDSPVHTYEMIRAEYQRDKTRQMNEARGEWVRYTFDTFHPGVRYLYGVGIGWEKPDGWGSETEVYGTVGIQYKACPSESTSLQTNMGCRVPIYSFEDHDGFRFYQFQAFADITLRVHNVMPAGGHLVFRIDAFHDNHPLPGMEEPGLVRAFIGVEY